MVIGGVSFLFIYLLWYIVGEWLLLLLCVVLFVIIFGMFIVFYCYLESLKYISVFEVIVFVLVEFLLVVVFFVLWFYVIFGWMEWLGMIFIIVMVFLFFQ